MRTVRRLYFYTVTFVSLEIVLWGMIGLARSILAASFEIGAGLERLTVPLALVLAGLPLFVLHWRAAQRDAGRDAEEHASGVRAVFLYAVLLATLIPIAQNFLALLDRALLQAFGLPSSLAFLGAGQSLADNLVAMMMNAILAVYFQYVLHDDWYAITPQDSFRAVRRLFRYVWMLYALALVTAGVQQLLRFLVAFPASAGGTYHPGPLANGLALLLIGVPAWLPIWHRIQASQAEEAERESLLRLVVLYFLALAGVVTVLAAGGVVVSAGLRLLLGEQEALAVFLESVSGPLSLGLALGGVWAYFGHWLGRTISASADSQRQAGMRRLYHYLLSTIGLGATFTGLALLLAFVVDAALGNLLWAETLRPRLADSLATVLVATPLWVLAWQPMQNEALAAGDPGDHARRSILRRAMLYLVLFASVVGGMITAVGLFNQLLKAALGQPASDLVQQALKSLAVLLLFVGMGVYHGLTLRRDGQRSAGSLAEKHAAFKILVLDPGDGEFAQAIQTALQKQAPQIPAAFQLAAKPIAKRAVPRAVLLPSDLALDPPDGLRRWLEKYRGHKVLVPRPAGEWTWAGSTRPLPAAADQAALAVRQLAEGQAARLRPATPGWQVFLYVMAGLFALEVVLALASAAVSLFNR